MSDQQNDDEVIEIVGKKSAKSNAALDKAKSKSNVNNNNNNNNADVNDNNDNNDNNSDNEVKANGDAVANVNENKDNDDNDNDNDNEVNNNNNDNDNDDDDDDEDNEEMKITASGDIVKDKDKDADKDTFDELLMYGEKFGEKCPCMWYCLYNMMTGSSVIRVINYSLTFLLFFSFICGHHLSMSQYSSSNYDYCNALPNFPDKPKYVNFQCQYVKLLAEAYIILFSADVVLATLSFFTCLYYMFQNDDANSGVGGGDDGFGGFDMVMRLVLSLFFIMGALLYLSGVVVQIVAVCYIYPSYSKLSNMIALYTGEMLIPVTMIVFMASEMFFIRKIAKNEVVRTSLIMATSFCVFMVCLGAYASLSYHHHQQVQIGEYITLSIGYCILSFTALLYFIGKFFVVKKFGSPSNYVNDKNFRICLSCCWLLGGLITVVGYLVVGIKVAENKQLYLLDYTKHILLLYVDKGLLTMYYFGYLLLLSGLTKIVSIDFLYPDTTT